MDDEHKAIRDVERANQADALLKSELLIEIFDALERTYIDEMLNTGVAQADSYKRDRLHQAVHILRKVKDGLRQVANNGKVARAHLVAIEGKRQRAA